LSQQVRGQIAKMAPHTTMFALLTFHPMCNYLMRPSLAPLCEFVSYWQPRHAAADAAADHYVHAAAAAAADTRGAHFFREASSREACISAADISRALPKIYKGRSCCRCMLPLFNTFG